MPPKGKYTKGKAVKEESVVSEKSELRGKERESFLAGLDKRGMIGNIKKKIDFISTGSWSINRIIGDGTLQNMPGGIPRGYITEIYGDESTGKTTLALHIAKQALIRKETVVYADFELSLRTQFTYIENLGINTSDRNFVHLTPPNLEDGAKAIGECLIKLRPSIIVVDSIAAMMPKDFVNKNPDEVSAIGLHARLVGSFVNWISKHLTKYNCGLILINQMRANIKKSQYDPGPTTVTTGGNALKFFCCLRIRLKKTSNQDKIRETNLITGLREDKLVSQEVKVVVEKNKLDIPFKSAPIYITFGRGIDNISSLMVLAINKKVIKEKGDNFVWDDPDGGKHSFKVSGKPALKKYLEEHPATMDALQPYLTPAKDDAEIDNLIKELEEKGIPNLNEEEIDQLRDLRKSKGLPIDDLEGDSQQMSDLADLNSFAEGLDKKDKKEVSED